MIRECTARSDFSRFVGVNLGGGKGRNTFIARLERNGSQAHVSFVGSRTTEDLPFYDGTLLTYLKDALSAGDLVAINAPLTLTTCVRCRLPTCVGLETCMDPTVKWFRDRSALADQRDVGMSGQRKKKPAYTPYTQRACEVILQENYALKIREALGQGTGPLSARAHYLTRALAKIGVRDQNLIEVYPRVTLEMLFGTERARHYKRGAATWQARAEILESLGKDLVFNIWREGVLRSDHAFDAVLSAYTGYLWAKEGWVHAPDENDIFKEDGWICVPPPMDPPKAAK